jgi:hypothetical protein
MGILSKLFGRKPVAPPAPPKPAPTTTPLRVKATMTAQRSRQRYIGPGSEKVMSDAVNEAHKAREGNDPAKMAAWISQARAALKQAVREMEETGKPAYFNVGTIRHSVEPPQ